MEQLDDIQCFSLYEVARATGNFSVSNKIRQGGFGPVYKDGRQIAVKRLSETSQQGLHEFKNEVICIAKLQHRNLVKLLGHCIHQNGLILICEYMTITKAWTGFYLVCRFQWFYTVSYFQILYNNM
ncbi:putative protein kinase RLK-Pelle-DLSV family [Helianthus anomalus]